MKCLSGQMATYSSIPSTSGSPSHSSMDLDQPGPSMKRKLEPMEVDEKPDIEPKVIKLELPSRPSSPPLMTDDEIQEMNTRMDNMDDLNELYECFENIYLNLDSNVDYDATPLDAIDLHYCTLCKSHLGKFENVLYSKVQFHMHCVIVHKFEICKFKPCTCWYLYKRKAKDLRKKK